VQSAPGSSAPPLLHRAFITTVFAGSLIALILALPLGAAGYITEAFAGSSLIFLVTWRRRADWMAAAAIAVLLGGIYALSRAAVTPWTGWEIAFPASLYGVAALLVLVYRATGMPPAESRKTLEILGNTALIPGLCLVSIVAVWLDMRFTPRTWDWSLYTFDHSFGVEPSFFLGRIYWQHSTLRFLAGLFYSSLPVNMCLICAIWLRRRRLGAPDARLAFVIMGVLGFLLYQLCPAAGPLYLTGRAFPYHELPVSGTLQNIVISGAPRNAMPSLHIASCLLIVYNSWRHSLLLRIYTLVCLVLTAFATLGTGEHYLVDLIVAVPLSVAVQLVCSKRMVPAAALLALVAAWLLALRTGAALQPDEPWHMWSAVAATLVASAIPALRPDFVRIQPDLPAPAVLSPGA